VQDIGEAFAYAESLGLAPVAHLTGADGAPVDVPASPIRLSGTPVTYRTAPPAVGADTADVLDWLSPPTTTHRRSTP
jgi:crotonobetainyl-CoA:carnitine CoA-transferase CaiB-like acyl-CoA transferase